MSSLYTPYGRVISVTTDYAATKNDDLLQVPASEAAVNTITLAPASQKEVQWVHNLSSYPQKVAAASGDTLFGNALVLPGQLVRYDSNGIDWFAFGSENAAGVFSFSLSSANILGMNAAPVTMMPSPGTNRVIVVTDIHLQMTRTATAYANGGAVEFRYTDGSGAKVSADIAAAVITGGAGVAYAKVAGIEASLTTVPATPLIITNATAPFITGTGTGKIKIAYRIDDFS